LTLSFETSIEVEAIFVFSTSTTPPPSTPARWTCGTTNRWSWMATTTSAPKTRATPGHNPRCSTQVCSDGSSLRARSWIAHRAGAPSIAKQRVGDVERCGKVPHPSLREEWGTRAGSAKEGLGGQVGRVDRVASVARSTESPRVGRSAELTKVAGLAESAESSKVARLGRLLRPFRAPTVSCYGHPGRCPGLPCTCPFGAINDRTHDAWCSGTAPCLGLK